MLNIKCICSSVVIWISIIVLELYCIMNQFCSSIYFISFLYFVHRKHTSKQNKHARSTRTWHSDTKDATFKPASPAKIAYNSIAHNTKCTMVSGCIRGVHWRLIHSFGRYQYIRLLFAECILYGRSRPRGAFVGFDVLMMPIVDHPKIYYTGCYEIFFTYSKSRLSTMRLIYNVRSSFILIECEFPEQIR